MARRRSTSPRKRKRPARQTQRRPRRAFPWLRILLVLLVVLAAYGVYLDASIRAKFEGQRWALPARVYAQPLELYTGLELSPARFAAVLDRLGYQQVPALRHAGEFSRDRDRFHVHTQRFQFWDATEPARRLRIDFAGGRISAISDLAGGRAVPIVRLEPEQIASIYPTHGEDRILVSLDGVPDFLTAALIATEDRGFYDHHGISLRGIARALFANIRAGGVVQGGSTLTQQLVKNFFLTHERTLVRKLNEALMALLLELHYSKNEILEAYLNEVYLGQDGARSIHGFGLASRFYYGRALEALTPEQTALLVGMVKGPSYYDPRRHPERARERRNLVLELLAEQGRLEARDAARLQARPLGVVDKRRVASNAHPAFLELVRRQLQRDYREEDLRSEGLRIFTTLDPLLQRTVEAQADARLTQLERGYNIEPDALQAAVIVTRYQNGEVLALLGDRDPHAAGFNRALEARRQIGSLIKPFVYLTALESGGYTLASRLEDTPFTLDMPIGDPWQPRNYDRKFRGEVLLIDALVESLNVPTARVGLDTGLDSLIRTLDRMGLERDIRPLPSLLLGALELTPLELTQLYQGLAANGFRSPLQAIREVVDAEGLPLQRYPLEVQRVAEPAAVSLVQFALREVALRGTARALGARFGAGAGLSGKTGTTDELRDSWFAGYDDDRLMVVWVGRDDNRNMGLTGSQGALQLWSEIMARRGVLPSVYTPATGVELAEIDPASGLRADRGCADRVQLPFIEGTVPETLAPCARGEGLSPGNWFKRWFD
ncbi:penicillin-binding protein 1B [Thiohalobacter thiocyanaticus]|uniref:Penicillin-binding protein 1B n=1 Tax=Thiohalobacter thiocyanaticus TaxID=585455 RepID=A0A426QFW5_9GAMM|nr:penicillin-binding protein 1B [Thiohalobacter thiocyanaticus]RRQ20641.1 penicillin-binding protein 1B [Thiohalobacter thiocyanaticus]